MRGLNADCCTTGAGGRGFDEETNWGSVIFKHEVNSTVEPRYSAQLPVMVNIRAHKVVQSVVPAAHCRPTHERCVPKHVHGFRVQPNDGALSRERYTPRVLHHCYPVPESKPLMLQTVHCMWWL
jgi:hypothetical protein